MCILCIIVWVCLLGIRLVITHTHTHTHTHTTHTHTQVGGSPEEERLARLKDLFSKGGPKPPPPKPKPKKPSSAPPTEITNENSPPISPGAQVGTSLCVCVHLTHTGGFEDSLYIVQADTVYSKVMCSQQVIT